MCYISYSILPFQCSKTKNKKKSQCCIPKQVYQQFVLNSLIVELLATTHSAEALRSALGFWLTWTCQFKLFFIFSSTDINSSFIPSIYALGFKIFLRLNIHSFFLLFTHELIFAKKFLVFTSFFVMMSFYTFNVVSIRSLLLIST